MIKYNRYFKHWMTNKSLMQKVVAELKNVRTNQIEIVKPNIVTGGVVQADW